VIITVALSDSISVLIKNLVERPRPSRNPEIANLVHIVNDYRGGMYGFVSSHAANFFGVATFLSHQFKHYRWSIFLFVWAIVVSYSRIYLGVHYPLDIIFGAILGALIGIQCYVFKVRTATYIEQCSEIRKEKREAKRKLK
jgi:undecaprenyl-diphosphatase